VNSRCNERAERFAAAHKSSIRIGFANRLCKRSRTRANCPDSSADLGLVAICVASVTAFVSASSHSNSWTVCNRFRGDWEIRSDRQDSILAPVDVGKLRPALAREINLRRAESSEQDSAKRRAQSLVNQTTSAVCGRDSSMAEVDAQV